jgi:hypothetical protein
MQMQQAYPSQGAPQQQQQAQQQQQYAVELCSKDGQPHNYQRDFTCCGIAWAVLCFPCGLICLFNDRKTKCIKCNKEI